MVIDFVRRSVILFGTGLFLVIFLLSNNTAFAAEFGNIGGKPARARADNPRSQSIFVHEIEPGASVEDAIEVVNYTDETKTLLIYPTDSVISTGGAFGCAQKVDAPKDVGTWVTMSRTEVTLEAGGTTEIPFTVTAPQRANVGENNGCIVVQEKTTDTQDVEGEGGRVALSFRTAIRLAVWIPGDIEKGLRILGYQAAPEENRTYTLKPRVQNFGNVSVDAQLKTDTSSLLGTDRKTTDQNYPILRGGTSDWNIEYKPNFWGGFYKSFFTVTYDTNVENFLGESKNKNEETLQSDTIYFFVAPHPIAALLEIGALIIAGIGLWRLFMFWKRRRKVAEEWRIIIIEEQTDIVSFAEKFGVSWKLMAKVNKLKAPYILRPGDAIRVPASVADDAGSAGAQEVKIITIDRPMDITELAKAHGIGWKRLAKLNSLKAPYILRPGDMIRIPVASQGGRIAKIANIAKRKPAPRLVPVVVDAHTDIVSFAESHNLEWRELAKINKLKPPYILKPGYVVMVPEAAAHSVSPQQQTRPVNTADTPAAPETPSPAPVATVTASQPVPPAVTQQPVTAPVSSVPQDTPPEAAQVPYVAPHPSENNNAVSNVVQSEPTQSTVDAAPVQTQAEPQVITPTPPTPSSTITPPVQAPAQAPTTQSSAGPAGPYVPVLPAKKPDTSPSAEETEYDAAEDELQYEITPIDKPAAQPAPRTVEAPEPRRTQKSQTQRPKPTPKPQQPPKPKVFKIQDVKKVSGQSNNYLGYRPAKPQPPSNKPRRRSDESWNVHDDTDS